MSVLLFLFLSKIAKFSPLFLPIFCQALHATHVAGIAAGDGVLSHGQFAGIAPGAHLIGVKILNEKGLGSTARAIAGLHWIREHKAQYNIRVANLSIGSQDRTTSLPLLRAVAAAWEAGIAVVAAAGNRDAASTGIARPRQMPRLITVGAVEDGYAMAPYGDYGTFADIVAPGEEIVSCLSPHFRFNGRSRSPNKKVGEHYIAMTGTSMATPMAAGAIALLLEKEPRLTPDEIKLRLRKSALITQSGHTRMYVLSLRRLLE